MEEPIDLSPEEISGLNKRMRVVEKFLMDKHGSLSSSVKSIVGQLFRSLVSNFDGHVQDLIADDSVWDEFTKRLDEFISKSGKDVKSQVALAVLSPDEEMINLMSSFIEDTMFRPHLAADKAPGFQKILDRVKKIVKTPKTQKDELEVRQILAEMLQVMRERAIPQGQAPDMEIRDMTREEIDRYIEQSLDRLKAGEMTPEQVAGAAKEMYAKNRSDSVKLSVSKADWLRVGMTAGWLKTSDKLIKDGVDNNWFDNLPVSHVFFLFGMDPKTNSVSEVRFVAHAIDRRTRLEKLVLVKTIRFSVEEGTKPMSIQTQERLFEEKRKELNDFVRGKTIGDLKTKLKNFPLQIKDPSEVNVGAPVARMSMTRLDWVRIGLAAKWVE
jgi:hypothetical protein